MAVEEGNDSQIDCGQTDDEPTIRWSDVVRLPTPRFRVRSLMLAVALVALVLACWERVLFSGKVDYCRGWVRSQSLPISHEAREMLREMERGWQRR